MTHNLYEQNIREEANLWGEEAERMAQEIAPDWREHRYLRHNRILHGTPIDRLLLQVDKGMTVAELGCASGWLTLAMAQQGADAIGYDVSEKALEVGREYYKRIEDSVTGTVRYEVADLNQIDLPENHFDVIAVKAALHHLERVDHVIEQIYKALKPNGLLWVSDTDGDEDTRTALVAGGLMFLLPNYSLSYWQKIQAVLKFGANITERVQASMESEGLSPFEGAGREHDWMTLIQQHFNVVKIDRYPAITGYVAAQFNAPDSIAIPLLLQLKQIDQWLTNKGYLHSTGVVIEARKP